MCERILSFMRFYGFLTLKVKSTRFFHFEKRDRPESPSLLKMISLSELAKVSLK